ncbi:hypothetical protein BH11PSE2_BH11PSE2_21270 [soil metagenome]
MTRLTRRGVISAAAAASAAGPALGAARPDTIFTKARIAADLARYVGFGIKASGGKGDQATAAWVAGELKTAGFAVQRQAFQAPMFTGAARLSAGAHSAMLVPQAIVVPTGPGGLEGPLAARPAGTPASVRCDRAIAIVVLPPKRWTTFAAADSKGPAAEAFAAGAAAVVLVTTGPTGEALALNAPSASSQFDRPVAVLAPREAQPFLDAAARGERGRLTMAGVSGRRPAFNVIGRLDRGAGRHLVISTPRSGWFTCGGERGGGVATWLALARWAPTALPHHDITFLATSGHEYENQGGAMFLEHLAPPPKSTVLWLHLGANVAARDWQEGASLSPLPGPDPARVLMASRDLVPAASRLFAGQPGLETVRPADPKTAAGELSNILAAGYSRLAGVFGSHRFHHTRSDGIQCTHPDATLAAAVSFRDLIAAALA